MTRRAHAPSRHRRLRRAQSRVPHPSHRSKVKSDSDIHDSDSFADIVAKTIEPHFRTKVFDAPNGARHFTIASLCAAINTFEAEAAGGAAGAGTSSEAGRAPSLWLLEGVVPITREMADALSLTVAGTSESEHDAQHPLFELNWLKHEAAATPGGSESGDSSW